MTETVRGKIKLVSKFGGIMLEHHDKWINGDKDDIKNAVGQAKDQLKGCEVTLTLNDKGHYTALSTEGSGSASPGGQAASPPVDQGLSVRIAALQAAATMFTSPGLFEKLSSSDDLKNGTYTLGDYVISEARKFENYLLPPKNDQSVPIEEDVI